MARRGTSQLEAILKEIQQERRHRLDILAMEPMVPRGFRRRPRPKTAIIAEAAKVAAAVSKSLQAIAENVHIEVNS